MAARSVPTGRSSRSSPSPPSGGDSDTPALTVSGWTDKFQKLNGVYEPGGALHDHTFWAHHTKGSYIYHSGASRWVLGPWPGDGKACFAFIQDNRADIPTKCAGDWSRPTGAGGKWSPDREIKVTEAPIKVTVAPSRQSVTVAPSRQSVTVAPSRQSRQSRLTIDPFSTLRCDAEDEMHKLHMVDKADLQKLWLRIDAKGIGVVDLADVQTLIKDMVKTGNWPQWVDDEEALQRAFAQTLEESTDGDDKVQLNEFHDLLLNIFWFGKMHEVFTQVETEDDHYIDISEFQVGCEKLGLRLTPEQVKSEFSNMDQSQDGVVEFAEFCMYIRSKAQPGTVHDGKTNHDATKIECHDRIVTACGKGSTTGVMIKKKAWGDFSELEAKIQKLAKDPNGTGLKKLWRSLDYNGNNKVSLAETDKWIVEQYPLLNHKPAIMRAQQSTLAAGGGEDFIEKKDFKALLVNVFYYNKLFWMFDQADQGQDRRMDFKEFQYMLTMCGMNLVPAKAQAEFDKIDQNHGGQILFDEFCAYFVEKKCPEALTDFVAN